MHLSLCFLTQFKMSPMSSPKSILDYVHLQEKIQNDVFKHDGHTVVTARPLAGGLW